MLAHLLVKLNILGSEGGRGGAGCGARSTTRSGHWRDGPHVGKLLLKRCHLTRRLGLVQWDRHRIAILVLQRLALAVASRHLRKRRAVAAAGVGAERRRQHWQVGRLQKGAPLVHIKQTKWGHTKPRGNMRRCSDRWSRGSSGWPFPSAHRLRDGVARQIGHLRGNSAGRHLWPGPAGGQRSDKQTSGLGLDANTGLRNSLNERAKAVKEEEKIEAHAVLCPSASLRLGSLPALLLALPAAKHTHLDHRQCMSRIMRDPPCNCGCRANYMAHRGEMNGGNVEGSCRDEGSEQTHLAVAGEKNEQTWKTSTTGKTELKEAEEGA